MSILYLHLWNENLCLFQGRLRVESSSPTQLPGRCGGQLQRPVATLAGPGGLHGQCVPGEYHVKFLNTDQPNIDSEHKTWAKSAKTTAVFLKKEKQRAHWHRQFGSHLSFLLQNLKSLNKEYRPGKTEKIWICYYLNLFCMKPLILLFLFCFVFCALQVIELLMTCTLYLVVSTSLLSDSLSGAALPRLMCSLLSLLFLLPCLLLTDLRPVSTLSLLCSLAHVLIRWLTTNSAVN